MGPYLPPVRTAGMAAPNRCACDRRFCRSGALRSDFVGQAHTGWSGPMTPSVGQDEDSDDYLVFVTLETGSL